jgi:hypothetical protein
MKKLMLLIPVVFIAGVLLIVNSCKKDESFTQISAFERGIHNAVNDYRTSIGKPEMVLQFLLMNDAKTYSAKMANESVAFGIEGVTAELENQKVLLAADSSAAWVAYCEYENADSVMSIVLKDPVAKAKIEGYFNQSAIGTAVDANGNFYVTGLMLHFSSK